MCKLQAIFCLFFWLGISATVGQSPCSGAPWDSAAHERLRACDCALCGPRIGSPSWRLVSPTLVQRARGASCAGTPPRQPIATTLVVGMLRHTTRPMWVGTILRNYGAGVGPSLVACSYIAPCLATSALQNCVGALPIKLYYCIGLWAKHIPVARHDQTKPAPRGRMIATSFSSKHAAPHRTADRLLQSCILPMRAWAWLRHPESRLGPPWGIGDPRRQGEAFSCDEAADEDAIARPPAFVSACCHLRRDVQRMSSALCQFGSVWR